MTPSKGGLEVTPLAYDTLGAPSQASKQFLERVGAFVSEARRAHVFVCAYVGWGGDHDLGRLEECHGIDVLVRHAGQCLLVGAETEKGVGGELAEILQPCA